MGNAPYRIKSALPVLTLAAFAALAALSSCRQGQATRLPTRAVFTPAASPLPGSFSLAAVGGTPYLCYTDRESLALLLSAVDPAGEPEYLDRITDLPENDSLLGSHLLLGGEGFLHLLYLDSRTEEMRLLKYVKKDPRSGTTWIDVLPESGKPVAVWPAEGGGIDIFLEREGALYRLRYPGSAPARQAKAPFSAGGPASLLASSSSSPPGAAFRGFTVFDLASQRLLLLYDRAGETVEAAVARFGEVHHGCLAEDGTLQVLAYDPRSLRLVLFESRDPEDGFRERPVTLARGTTCLALASCGERPLFLFNETEVGRRTRHLLSLLAPAGRNGYRKYLLHEGAAPVTGLRTAPSASGLYVAFQEDALRVVELDFSALEDVRP